MPLPIVHYNEPVLRQKGEKITAFDAPLAALAAEMIETMHEAHGIGLAAQQVGRVLQLCVVDLRSVEADFTWELDGSKPPLELFMPLIVVNPRITPRAGAEPAAVEEGCLSFPDIRGEVSRPEAIVAKFRDERGVAHVLACDGLLARCLQHEADHLNGILFIDRMTRKARAPIEPEIKALAQQRRLARSAALP
jgi:peptide deformylase